MSYFFYSFLRVNVITCKKQNNKQNNNLIIAFFKMCDNDKALINEVKKKRFSEIFKTKTIIKYSRTIDDPSKTTNGFSEGTI